MISLLSNAIFLATTVSAHGYVQYITANGVKSLGYDPGFRYQSPAPLVAGWFADNPDIGFVPPINYTSPDIICHKSSTPGQKYVTVTAGSTIQLQWNPAPWPESHVGPIIDYLAPCPSGSCTNVAKADLKFVKLAQQALKAGVTSSTDWLKAWVVDDFIKGGSVWNVTIPKDIKKGVYVLRHEIIALHSAYSVDGAQNYPQCVNLNVTGGGTREVTGGKSAMQFYGREEAGVVFNVYGGATTYPFPGPALWK